MTDSDRRKVNQEKCSWCLGDTEYECYHDSEWGVPQKDDRILFEKISLEGFQAGLSWITILRKRDNFRKSFDNFDIEKVGYRTLKSVASTCSKIRLGVFDCGSLTTSSNFITLGPPQRF